MSEKILLIADSDSPHVEKWATALADKGHVIGIFSLNKAVYRWFEGNKNIIILYEPKTFTEVLTLRDKLKYILVLPKLLRILRKFKPDILHAHYATSYGLLGALTGFRPFILSTWGSDIFEFPNKSIFHKWILKFNLGRAEAILSTSNAMKKEVARYTSKQIEVTPFGVDMSVFYPRNVKSETEKKMLYVGMIKSIEDKYGVQNIIEAVDIIKNRNRNLKFKVLLVGDGNRMDFYKKEISGLGLEDNFIFPGKISFAEISHYHNLLDIFLNVSNVNESFGVSVIEAMACGKPVIVTNAGGLTEIVEEGLGIIIKKNNSDQLANAIENLIANPELTSKMATKARQYVMSKYNFEDCLKHLDHIYWLVTNKSYHYNTDTSLRT